jgi:Protein of unknown function VcgC/VcgE (DUF2780)
MGELNKRHFIKKTMGWVLVLIFGIMLSPGFAGDMGLVDLLSSQLGVSKDKATGGAGSIFQMAKQNLGDKDFSSVAKTVPGIDQMMAAAPKADKKSSSLGGLSSMMGGSSSKLQGMSGLTSSFKSLGMSGDMVGKFTPIILNFVKGKGGEGTMNLLKGALL